MDSETCEYVQFVGEDTQPRKITNEDIDRIHKIEQNVKNIKQQNVQKEKRRKTIMNVVDGTLCVLSTVLDFAATVLFFGAIDEH